MICIRRLRSRNDLPFSWVMFSPSRKTSPAVGATRRRRSRATVDLPLPDSPTSPRVRPSGQLETDSIDGPEGSVPSSRESYSVGLGYAVAGRTDLRPTRTGCTISDGVEIRTCRWRRCGPGPP